MQTSPLYYRKEGTGKKSLLLFHGFGQDHTAFDSIQSELSSKYTVYSFDIYFHGKSVWCKGEEPITKNEWKNTVEQFLRENDVQDFSMVSFSIGTKFLLSTLEAFPDRVREVFLIAPDGITNSFWYSLATGSAFFRGIFKRLMEKPEAFLAVVHKLQQVRVIPQSVFLFVKTQLRSSERRRMVYGSWVAFRNLHVPNRKVADLLNEYAVHTAILIGKHDSIIPEKKIKPLLKRLHTYSLDIADAGHHQLLKKDFLLKLWTTKEV